MASVREKGKIARNEWPRIIARYNKGETIAQLGRDYGCTAPAIRYIIKRAGSLKEPAVEGPLAPAAGGPQARSNAVLEAAAPIAADALPGRDSSFSPDLRRRVTGDIAAFLVALDQAVLNASADAVASLQDAADRLMRSTARVRLELERLADSQDAARRGAKRMATPSATRPQRP